MNAGYLGLLGAAVGWALNELTRLIYYNKERKERRLGIYQQAYARLRQLEDILPNARNFAAISPSIDEFKQWCYQNNLYLDRQTEAALVGVYNAVVTNMLPRKRAANILLITNVKRTFDKAEKAIRAATGEQSLTDERLILGDFLLREYAISNMSTYFFFGLFCILAFYLSPSRGAPSMFAMNCTDALMAILKWLPTLGIVIIGGIAILLAITLLVIILWWDIVKKIGEPRLRRFIIWNTRYYGIALTTVFAISFMTNMADLINAGLSAPFVYALFIIGIVLLVSPTVYRIIYRR